MGNNLFPGIIRSLVILFISVILVGCSGGASGDGSGAGSLSVSIISPPLDWTINVGESVDFQATASGGTGPYAYKWQYVANWGTGGSATESIDENPFTLSFPKAGIYTFNLTVTDSTGTLVSEAVRVTVQ